MAVTTGYPSTHPAKQVDNFATCCHFSMLVEKCLPNGYKFAFLFCVQTLAGSCLCTCLFLFDELLVEKKSIASIESRGMFESYCK